MKEFHCGRSMSCRQNDVYTADGARRRTKEKNWRRRSSVTFRENRRSSKSSWNKLDRTFRPADLHSNLPLFLNKLRFFLWNIFNRWVSSILRSHSSVKSLFVCSPPVEQTSWIPDVLELSEHVWNNTIFLSTHFLFLSSQHFLNALVSYFDQMSRTETKNSTTCDTDLITPFSFSSSLRPTSRD